MHALALRWDDTEQGLVKRLLRAPQGMCCGSRDTASTQMDPVAWHRCDRCKSWKGRYSPPETAWSPTPWPSCRMMPGTKPLPLDGVIDRLGDASSKGPTLTALRCCFVRVRLSAWTVGTHHHRTMLVRMQCLRRVAAKMRSHAGIYGEEQLTHMQNVDPPNRCSSCP